MGEICTMTTKVGALFFFLLLSSGITKKNVNKTLSYNAAFKLTSFEIMALPGPNQTKKYMCPSTAYPSMHWTRGRS